MADRPIQGFNVSTLVTGSSGPELAGEFQEVEFSIKNGTEEYLELGERIAAILDGEIKIEGKLKRGMINLGIVKSCFGASTLKRGGSIPSSPRFTITANINAPNLGLVGKYRLLNVVIPELTVSMSKGKDVVKNDFSFKAEGIEEAA
jgi:hypothetical protein